MKLFLIGLGHMRREQINVARALAKRHTIQYWVRMNQVFGIDEREFPGTVFHDYHDALGAKPAPSIAADAFDPPSSEDIKKLGWLEAEFMTMVDKWHPDWSVNQRADLFYDMVRYWKGVLEQFSPDALIIPVVPHEMYSFVLYHLARQSGVRTLILDAVLENDRYILVEDYREGNAALRDASRAPEAKKEDLSEQMRAHYERISREANPAPKAMREFIQTQKFWRVPIDYARVVLAFMRDGSIIRRMFGKIGKSLRPDMKDEYRAYEKEPDFDAPFVYFPLHYQPEATTSPLGGPYVDQPLAIKTLAAALPKGWEIYVKEHPAQMGVHGGNSTPARYRGFYRTIAAISHVRLVPISTNTFTLTDRAQATATITGTAAWESVLRGKPALVFGYPWFMHAPGNFRVRSTDDCRVALARIAAGSKPSEHDMLRYLKVLDTVSCPGYLQAQTPGYEEKWSEMLEMIQEGLRA